MSDVRTRPLEDVGPIRKIGAHVTFDGRNVRLDQLTADLGGQTLIVTGTAKLSGDELQRRELPPFAVRISGTNIPLVRRPDVVIRADLDLSATNSRTATPTVSGKVRLHDSIFLSDLRVLEPRLATPSQRPPFFSIEQEPWAGWLLALNVQGAEFLKVRSPIFRGVVSMTLHLAGTLKNPMALGELRLNSGAVTFPFGSLDVKQGFISLTSENPYDRNCSSPPKPSVLATM